jgi:hypothetical protein
MSMSDHAFDMVGDRTALICGAVQTEPDSEDSSRFVARFGVTLFWALVIAIVSARIFVGV